MPDVVWGLEGGLIPPEDPVPPARAVDLVFGDRSGAAERAGAARHRPGTECSVAQRVLEYDPVYRHELGDRSLGRGS